jgi:hypothetical protein
MPGTSIAETLSDIPNGNPPVSMGKPRGILSGDSGNEEDEDVGEALAIESAIQLYE